MRPHHRRLAFFASGFIPLLVGAAWLYPSILPPYQRVVLGTVNAVLATLSPVAEVRAVLEGRWQVLVHRVHTGRIATYTLGGTNIGLSTFFQLVVLAALLLATPVSLKERLRLLCRGIGLMFAFHVLCVAGCAYGMALVDDSKSAVFRSLPIILGPFASGLAAVVWSLLTWRYWLAEPAPAPIRISAGAAVRRRGDGSWKTARRSARHRHAR